MSRPCQEKNGVKKGALKVAPIHKCDSTLIGEINKGLLSQS